MKYNNNGTAVEIPFKAIGVADVKINGVSVVDDNIAEIDDVQEKLISGENIKTINSQSILGSGNIEIQGGGAEEVYIQGEEPTDEEWKLWINPDEELTSLGTEVTNSLEGDETYLAPSVAAVNDTLETKANLTDGNTFTGDQKVQGIIETENVVSRNLFDKKNCFAMEINTGVEELERGVRIKVTSAFTSCWGAFKIKNIENHLGKTLTLTMDVQSHGGTAYAALWYVNGASETTKLQEVTSGTTTIQLSSSLPSGSDGLALYLYAAHGSTISAGNYVDYLNIQLEEGSVASSYVPYLNLKEAMSIFYPIGSIYMSINNINPSILFGGTWERIVGRFLIGASSEDGDWSSVGLAHSSSGYWYYNINDVRYRVDAGQTNGEAAHLLSVGEMPSHEHTVKDNSRNIGLSTGTVAGSQNTKRIQDLADSTYGLGDAHALYANSTGGNQPHNNLPPYLAVYIWRRVS